MDKQIFLEEGNVLFYCKKLDGIHITGYQGNAQDVVIPEQIEDTPVTAVDRKAFQNSRKLHTIRLPETIKTIGDWAFANCTVLDTVTLPKKEIGFGQKVFFKVLNLRRIYFCISPETLKEQRELEEIAAMFAASSCMLKADYLLNPLEAGSESWIRSFDERMLTILRQNEEDVLRELVFCAEEDIEEKQEIFLNDWHKRKAELAFFRLHYSIGLEAEKKKFLQEYLCQRTKGCESEAAWEVLKKDRIEQLKYAEILLDAGGIHDLNYMDMLADLGEYHTELKAYLMRWKMEFRSTEHNSMTHDSTKQTNEFWEMNFSL